MDIWVVSFTLHDHPGTERNFFNLIIYQKHLAKSTLNYESITSKSERRQECLLSLLLITVVVEVFASAGKRGKDQGMRDGKYKVETI